MRVSIKISRLILLSVAALIWSCGPDLGPTYSTTEIRSNQIKDKLFIKTINWGVTGDNQKTTISTTDDVDFDKEQSEDYYIFNGLEPFFTSKVMTRYIYFHRQL